MVEELGNGDAWIGKIIHDILWSEKCLHNDCIAKFPKSYGTIHSNQPGAICLSPLRWQLVSVSSCEGGWNVDLLFHIQFKSYIYGVKTSVQKKFKATPSAGKALFTFFWDIQKILLLDFLEVRVIRDMHWSYILLKLKKNIWKKQLCLLTFAFCCWMIMPDHTQ